MVLFDVINLLNIIYYIYIETLKSSHGEVTVKCLPEIPCHTLTSNLKRFNGEVYVSIYNYFFVVNTIPTQ